MNLLVYNEKQKEYIDLGKMPAGDANAEIPDFDSNLPVYSFQISLSQFDRILVLNQWLHFLGNSTHKWKLEYEDGDSQKAESQSARCVRFNNNYFLQLEISKHTLSKNACLILADILS